MAEHAELAFRLSERPGLLVLAADPLSGASGVMALALDEVERDSVLRIDARSASDAMDLAMAITDVAIPTLAPSAAPWWNDPAGHYDQEGLRLAHRLEPIELEKLRVRGVRQLDRLRDALEVVTIIGEGSVLLAVDHFDTLLERMSERDARELLGVFRADRQRQGAAELLLVGRSGGRLATALEDRTHPLYGAGDVLRIARAHPRRFVDDLRVIEPRIDPEVHTALGTSAELANGAPAYVWRIVDRALEDRRGLRDGALDAWRALCEDAKPQTAQLFETLGSTHRAAPTILSAMACGLGPYEAPLNDKTVNDALRRLRARGAVFAPAARTWAITDPVLAAWARQHAPSWVARRRASARTRRL